MKHKTFFEYNGVEFGTPYAFSNEPTRIEVLPNGNILAGWIEQDENPVNPRVDCDNLGSMVCFHNRYNLGDKHSYKSGDFSGWDELKEQIVKDNGLCVILSCYLYDHSGLTVNTTGFSCPWDSGQIGFIYVSYDKLRKEYGWKCVTKSRRDKAAEYLLGEVAVYDDYLTGNVWSVTSCEYKPDGTIVGEPDSCFGYFGRKYAEQELEARYDYLSPRAST